MEYTLFYWQSDDEGGYGICPKEEFTPKKCFNPDSGWRARPSERIGDFSTNEELAELFLPDYTPYMGEEEAKKEALAEAEYIMEQYLED